MRAGTTPEGVQGDEQISRWVRGMFDRVAPRYDLLNHLLSLNIDKRWRRRAVKRLEDRLRRPGARVADLCCGSGDLLMTLQGRARGPVMGSDFSHQMLKVAAEKIRRAQADSLLFEADAMRLPLVDGSLDLVTAAFGFRNLVNYRAGLKEMLRVLKPGGMAAILEFSTPPNSAFRALYRFYSRHLLPRIGGLISGSPDAYSYLPESVRKFPGAVELAEEMRAAGFAEVEYERMTFGVVALHLGVK
jgi:demethylmenaquinone methyltransferase/2-methoxy-6-polyprenyl-1,4-benzoquinol methylase